MRNNFCFLITAALTAALACTDRSPTSPKEAAGVTSAEDAGSPIIRSDRRARNPGVVPPRGDMPLPAGTWGSDQASVTIRGGSATVKIFSAGLPPGGCFGSYGDAVGEIPNGRFSLPGTFTQLTGVYPGKIESPAQFTGVVEGPRMTITITVPSLPRIVGPFVLTAGVTNSWGPCLYP
ncbi:MAG: hypothetical protein ABJC07_10775 [Acidobacteriota bacterium]